MFMAHKLHFTDMVELIDHLLVRGPQSASTKCTHLTSLAVVALVFFALFVNNVFLVYAILVVLLA